MSKQSSIEWLEKICNDRGYYLMDVYFEQAKAMHKEERFQDFKEGFQAAVESLQGANNLVQSKKLGGNNE